MHRARQEPIVVNRDVRAVIVPAGIEVKLRTGSVGYITQALGGVREFPARVKCASLCWHTLNAALAGQAAPVTTE